MTTRNFDALFEPTSVALIGASPKEGSLGSVIRRNLMCGGFDGTLHLVNPRYNAIDDQPCVSSVSELPDTVDLAVIVAPARVLPETIMELGRTGGRAAIVISAGLTGQLKQQMLDAARPHCLRILGPNCIGLQAPHLGLDASFAARAATPGKLALVSQSGAIIAALLDWAAEEEIGFSAVVSLGDMADIDVGDMLDYLAADPKTDAILLYLEHITDARKFMSAARRASRTKPVIAIKAGRSAQAARAATSHTGALAGSDAVYDAALRRAGILRVDGLEELFDAAETLARLRPIPSGRLAVVTNGGGAGVLAADAVADEEMILADLGGKTLNALDHILPHHWSRANPVDIIGDAKGNRYVEALHIVLDDPDTDAVLVMNCPTALASSEEAARAVVSVHKSRGGKDRSMKPMLGCWLGAKTAAPASALLEEAGIPSFSTPRHAVRGFAYLVRHGEAQRQLTRTPPALPSGPKPDRETVRSVIRNAFSEERAVLTEPEAKAVLAAYAIPTVETLVAATPEDARIAAERLCKGGAGDFVAKICPVTSRTSRILAASGSIFPAQVRLKPQAAT